ncbi:rhomboid domain-containing protein 2 [Sphaeramia orbicularis]|uniref:rhomboid domain-containing protein 2 n=1 Tax=Sphaeramia orbicularis TaxID=375764 RepID=UPI00117DD7AD|nr:rhomboid domain-containing protein 2 [Sphaeramia orbicularis]
MIPTESLKIILQVFKDVFPVPTSGILTLVLLSSVLFGVQTCLDLTQGVFSVGASVFVNGHLHKLFLYPFYHRTFVQLLLNITALVCLSGSLEKGFGTVRFLFLSILLSTTTGLTYAFLDILQDESGQTEGLVSTALSCVALTTMHTRMTKGFLCGVSFPTMALPWVFLIITTILIPHTVLPCNIIAILVGWMYGKGWFSAVDMSEARASIVEKMMPFRLLRSISDVMFVPASTEERRKTLLPQINATPGSYPVQAYAPLSNLSTGDEAAMTYQGWPDYTGALPSPTPPLNPYGHGYALAYSHGPTQGHYAAEHAVGTSSNHFTQSTVDS